MSCVGVLAGVATDASVGDVGVGGIATTRSAIVDVVDASCGRLLLPPIIERKSSLTYEVLPWSETPPLADASLVEKDSVDIVDNRMALLRLIDFSVRAVKMAYLVQFLGDSHRSKSINLV